MKTILLTGSNGLLGQKLTRQLAEDKAVNLIATSRSASRIPFSNDFKFELLDISNKTEVDYIFDRYQPEVIINTAAMTSVDECEKDKATCWKTNVEGVSNITEAANRLNAHLIQISTDFVFDGLDGPYHEEDIPNPVSLYGLSKLEGEKIVQENAYKWSIIRTVLVYGVNKYLSRSNFVIWVKSSLEKGEKIRVVNDQFRTPTLVEDLADGCMQIVNLNKTGIYHISGNDFVSIFEFANRVAEVFGLDQQLITPVTSAQLHEHGTRPHRTGFILLKAMNELNYFPKPVNAGLSILRDQLRESFI